MVLAARPSTDPSMPMRTSWIHSTFVELVCCNKTFIIREKENQGKVSQNKKYSISPLLVVETAQTRQQGSGWGMWTDLKLHGERGRGATVRRNDWIRLNILYQKRFQSPLSVAKVYQFRHKLTSLLVSSESQNNIKQNRRLQLTIMNLMART